MAETIGINVLISSDGKSITITDTTNWSEVTGTIDSLTDITLNIYTSTTETYDYTYTLTSAEVDEYTSVSEITLTFEDILGRVYALDNWYNIQLVANTGDYVSNYADFLSDVYIRGKVYENLNDLYTPEPTEDIVKPIIIQVMYVEGLKYLGTSNYTDRDIKGKKRLNILNRYNP